MNRRSGQQRHAGSGRVGQEPRLRPAAVGRHRTSSAVVAFLILGAVAALGAALAFAAPPAEFGGPRGEGAGEYFEAQGIAVDTESGDAYVVDRNNNRIDKFGPGGEFLLSWGWGVRDASAEPQTCGPQASPRTTKCLAGIEGTGAGAFSFPEGAAVDNDPSSPSHGDLYVVDSRNDRIQKFSPSGEFLLAFGGEVNATTQADICLAGESCQAGVEGGGPGFFEGLAGRVVAVGAGGSVYVGDLSRVQRFSHAGAPEAQIALPGEERVDEVAVDPGGDLYVRGELPGVRKFEPTLPTGTEIGEPRDEAGSPGPIAVDPSGRLYLVDSGSPSLLGFAPGGEQISATSFEGRPTALTVGEPGAGLYLLEPERVRVLAPAPPGAPHVASQSSEQIGTSAATLGAVLNAEGGEETSYHFEYGTTAGYGNSTAPRELSPAPFEDQSVTARIGCADPALEAAEGKCLAPRTIYHFHLVAENAAHETAAGPDQTFETFPPVSIESISATAVSATSATLEAELNPNGLASTYHFEIDTAPYAEGEGPHGQSVPVPDGSLGSGTQGVIRSVQVQGLSPSTTYHYRVVARNALGTVEGDDHHFTAQSPVASILPDGRQWELVSPIDKHGQPIEALGSEVGDLIQASASGETITYGAAGSLLEDPAGNTSLVFSQALSERSASGWSTGEIATPHEGGAVGFIPGFRSEYKAFSPEMTRSVVEPEGEFTPLSPAATERTPYLRNADGSFTPLVTDGNVPEGVKFGRTGPQTGVEFAAANPELSEIVLTAPQALTSDFSPSFEPVLGVGGTSSLYGWHEGGIQLDSQIPPGEGTTCGGAGPACVPSVEVQNQYGGAATVGIDNSLVRNAVSANGARVIFTAGGRGLYLRDDKLGQTILLNAPGAGGKPSIAPSYQFADSEDSRIFFTDTARLTADSTARSGEPDLYECEISNEAGDLACHLRDLTIDANRGGAADVLGNVIGGAEDGHNVFYVADGALTPTASPGTCSAGGSSEEEVCNLYETNTETDATRLVAVVSNADGHDWNSANAGGGELQGLTARVSPNGRYLAFMSLRSLTGYENRDAVSGRRDEEVYLFDGAGAAHPLACVSCNPTGARPRGIEGIDFPGLLVDRFLNWRGRWVAGQIPGWTNFGTSFAQYQSRYLSNSGRLYFTSSDRLVPQDSNGKEDVYQYEPAAAAGLPQSDSCTSSSATYNPATGGCIDVLSSGTSGEESVFLDASESGDDVFILTDSNLAPQDVDSALDVYDAHVCSATSPCPPPPAPAPPACEGDSCQQLAVAPVDATPGSLTFQGAGNVLQCPKGKVKKAGKCEKKKQAKKPKKKKHAKKPTKKKHAHKQATDKRDQGASGRGGAK